jgi:hypothetical protein
MSEPPEVALRYGEFYLIFAAAFGWPTVGEQEFFQSEAISWLGFGFYLAGLLLFL